MSAIGLPAGTPPENVTLLLRLEGVAAVAGAVAGYHLTGGNWWLFALLFLAPDIAMLGTLRNPVLGSRLYNLAHTYTVPAAIAAVAATADAMWLLPYALIWIAHIGMDRALGYGLKYPGEFHLTHLGPIGKARRAQRLTDPD